MRSYLFVPGDDERKLTKGLGSGADALILDLEDAVAPDRKALARHMVADFLLAHRDGSPALFVRVNGLDTGLLLADLATVVHGTPAGIMLPKCRGASDIALLNSYLDVLEVREGIERDAIRLFPIVTEHAEAVLNLGSYRGAGPARLSAMLWGGEDLAADIGAFQNRTATGEYQFPFQTARALCLFAAAAAGVAAVDAVFTDFRDMAGLKAEAEAAARSGFSAKAAIHPAQVDIINRAFTPDDAALEWAEKVLAIFAQGSGAGVAALDGRMLDRPHLRLAENLLQRAGKLPHERNAARAQQGKVSLI